MAFTAPFIFARVHHRYMDGENHTRLKREDDHNMTAPTQDPVKEAIERMKWIDYTGFGEIDGHNIVVDAYLSDNGTPTLCIGILHGVDTVELNVIYENKYESVNHLDRVIEDCAEEYDLERVAGCDYWSSRVRVENGRTEFVENL